MSTLRPQSQLSAAATRYRFGAGAILFVTFMVILVILLGGRDAPTWALLYAVLLTFEAPFTIAVLMLLIAAVYEVAAGSSSRRP